MYENVVQATPDNVCQPFSWWNEIQNARNPRK